ncbi:hypothetical protein N7470_008992 [Penicillium chermesinum]|nr:hypothetical protein N7470_008992 [Penicillium chermesinum]
MIDDAWNASDIPRFDLGPPPVLGSIPPEQLAQRMGEALDAIHQKAPNARVFFVEYLALLGPATKPGVHISFNQERIDHHSRVALELRNAYALAAEPRSAWCERVPIHDLSADHVLGTDDPWWRDSVWRLCDGGNPCHPNLAGMKGVAGILLSRVKEAVATRP